MISGNFDGAHGAMGYLDGISKQVQTPGYISAVLELTHSRLAPGFDDYLDSLAIASPDSFHHVYEWAPQYMDAQERVEYAVGKPAMRLWRQTLKGHGRNKHASFEWRASKVPVPVDPFLAEGGSNETGFVKEGVHIFHWKAPVMEAGLEITVEAKIAKMLAFRGDKIGENGGSDAIMQRDKDGEATGVAFANVTEFTAGGGKTTGKFTNAFVTWWTTLADDYFENYVRRELERDLIDEKYLASIGARMGRRKSKQFSIGTATAAFHQAKTYGMTQIKKNERDYIAAARARRAMIYGTDD